MVIQKPKKFGIFKMSRNSFLRSSCSVETCQSRVIVKVWIILLNVLYRICWRIALDAGRELCSQIPNRLSFSLSLKSRWWMSNAKRDKAPHTFWRNDSRISEVCSVASLIGCSIDGCVCAHTYTVSDCEQNFLVVNLQQCCAPCKRCNQTYFVCAAKYFAVVFKHIKR